MILPVTICIPTFSRGRLLLPDAFATALAAAERYPGPVEILVYNDLAVQTVRVSGAATRVSVRVVNTPVRHSSLGAKRQAMVDMVQHNGWITWVDDDDLVMPWHLEGLAKVPDKAPFVSWGRWYVVKVAADGTVTSTEHAEAFGGIVFAARRARYEQVGGFRPISFGEDNDMRHRLEQLGGWVKIPRPSYICCHRQVRRASRRGKETEEQRAAAELALILKEPHEVWLEPAKGEHPVVERLKREYP